MFQYFNGVTASRREHPTEDLASAIANARIDGEPLSDIDTVSYYLIVATAGHDTTSATISGGLQALIENPDQLAALARQSRSDAAGHRGDDPLGHPGQGIHANRRQRHHCARSTRLPRAIRCCCLTCRPTATRTSSTTRSASTSAVTPTSIWPSGTACTSVMGAALARMEVNSFFSELLPQAQIH